MSAIKYDEGKPDFTYVSRELMINLAKVREYGSKKYTIYKSCNCALNVNLNQNTLNNYVDAVTTSSLNNLTPSMPKLSESIIKNGQEKIEPEYGKSIKNGEEQESVKIMDCQRKSQMKDFQDPANSVAGLTESVSTTNIQRDSSEVLFASHAMSDSDGSRNLNLEKKHSPTCESMQILRTGKNNWKKGFKYSRSGAAALRHIFSFFDNEDLDPESGLSHIAHAIASLEHLLYDITHHPQLDDRKDSK